MEIWAEAGQCEGDIEYAYKAVDAVMNAGAEAIKVQVLRPELIASPSAAMYDYLGTTGTQREAFANNLDLEAWKKVADYAHKRGVEFIPAVFDEQAAIEMAKVAPRMKIASGDITNWPLIEAAAHEVDRELIISTGGASADEIEDAVALASQVRRGLPIVLLACHLQYPTLNLADAHLGRVLAIGELIHKKGWHATLGYSDHTPGTATTPLLVALGVSAQEKHFTLLGKGSGKDHEFAVGPDELALMVEARNGVVTMFGNVELVPSPWEEKALVGARRSIHATRDIKRGELITRENSAPLRPFVSGAVIPAEWEAMMKEGVKAMIDIPAGEPIMKNVAGNVGGTLSVE